MEHGEIKDIMTDIDIRLGKMRNSPVVPDSLKKFVDETATDLANGYRDLIAHSVSPKWGEKDLKDLLNSFREFLKHILEDVDRGIFSIAY